MSLTHWVLIAVGVFLLIFDVWIALRRAHGLHEPTESQALLNWALRHPMLPFVFGVLMGHFFWPQLR